MAKRSHFRRELLVSIELQLLLALKLVLWFGIYVVVFTIALNSQTLYHLATGEVAIAQQEALVELVTSPLRHVAAIAAMGFLVWLHLVVYLHRLAGPAYRFRETLRQMARRRPPTRVVLRGQDLMAEVAEEFDALLAIQREERARLRRLNERVIEAATKLANCIGSGTADPKRCASYVRDVREAAEKLHQHLDEPGDESDDEVVHPEVDPSAPTLPASPAPIGV